MKRTGYLIICLILVLSIGPARPINQAGLEILWDEFGVPHIFAKSETGLAYGFAWAQMRSRPGLLLQLYGEARGRASEYWGPGEGGVNLHSDRWVRMMEIPARARAWYAQQDPHERAYVDAFATAINAYAKYHPETIASGLERVLPVGPEDVLAHIMRTLQFDFLVNPTAIAASIATWRQTHGKPALNSNTPGNSKPAEAPYPLGGSTGWAIGPQKSASGRAMLMINPHLPWFGRYVLYEAHLATGDLDFYGAGPIGFPTPGMGFNDHLGWTLTVNTIDAADLYELSLVDGHHYRWDGGTRSLEVGRDSLRVRQADGSFRLEPIEISRSIHGPIVAQDGDRALALRVGGLKSASIIGQYLQMMRARSETQFIAAIATLQIPLFTILYADRLGHIMMLFGGTTPKRPFGNWQYWSRVVPGDSSATLWTESLSFDELPLVRDPASGWLQNANEPPWTATLPRPLDPGAFPVYIAPREMTYRAQSSLRFLSAPKRLGFDEVIAAKFSTKVEMADHVLDALIAAARASTDARAVRAAQVLEDWDRKVDGASRGALLFETWVTKLGGAPRPKVEWTPEAPLTTPYALEAPEEAVAALAAAADEMIARHGRLDMAWGDVHRLRHSGYDWPASGASDPLGVLRGLHFGPARNGRRPVMGGDTFIAVVEFGDKPRAAALLPYGNTGPSAAMRFPDQMSRYAAATLRSVWKERREIEQHIAARERPPVALTP